MSTKISAENDEKGRILINAAKKIEDILLPGPGARALPPETIRRL
jgi:hypothetical protein